jgi:vacuolar-type H+-ATPase subunit F/Vma7
VGRVVALGEASLVAGFALAGATVVVAEDPEEVCRAWDALSSDVALVVFTPSAATALGPRTEETTALWVVMPS